MQSVETYVATGESARKEIFDNFKKVVPGLQPKDIHNFYYCSERNCKDICSKDSDEMTKNNKFKHDWLFNPTYGQCPDTKKWCLVYIDGQGMFCSMCRQHDVKMNNDLKKWNSIPIKRCRTATISSHLNSATSVHREAVNADERQSTSYFDREQEKKITSLKNEVYFKIFQSLYWLAKEEMPSSKISSLLKLIENMGVSEIKYFETRSEPTLRKMLLLIAQTIVSDLVVKIKQSDVFGLLTDEVTDIANICQLVSFVKYFDNERGKTDTIFIDSSDLLNFSPNASPDADAIVSCLTDTFEKLNLELAKIKAFVSDGASVMTGSKGGVATKLKEDLCKTMINIHCICHRLALACADTGDEFKFIRNFEENLIELWKFFKNSSKRLKIYVTTTLKSKEFDMLSSKRRKNIVKKMKKACRTRWLSLHAGVDAAYEEYEGLVKTLEKIRDTDKASGSLAAGLLKKIKNYEFLGTLYLLKDMLPNLSALSKVFQTGSLNFSRIIPSLKKCKSKLQEVEREGTVIENLKNDLKGRLRSLNIELTEREEMRLKTFPKKYVDSICKNIDERFPESTCKVLESFSIFDIDLLPPPDTDAFKVYGTEEVSCLAKQFLTNTEIDLIKEQWHDFKIEMSEMKTKYATLKKQFLENKLKCRKTSTEWTLDHILNAHQENSDCPFIIELARIASIIPVTNAWPERGARAVKRIKSRTRSSMKNDLLNALIHISLNGPPVHSKEADILLNKVTDIYVSQCHYKVPTVYSKTSVSSSTSTQTQAIIDVDTDSIASVEISKLECTLDITSSSDFLNTNLESDDSSSEDEVDDDDDVES